MILESKVALITGASAGIGKACAEILAESGSNLILIARRYSALEVLAKELNEKYGTKSHIIELDIRQREKVEIAINSIPEQFKSIDVLINNAGKARGLDKLQEGNIDDWEEMIDTNIKGLLYFSRWILPRMVDRGSGHVINIGSLAGHEVYPKGNVYCGTKFAVKALSKAMIIDLNGTGVKVTNIDPGLVETEFSEVRFHGDNLRAQSVYKGYQPLNARDIAEIVLFAVTRPQHVLLQDILVTPSAQANATIVNKEI